MKKNCVILFFFICFLILRTRAQVIPYGISSDTFKVVIYNTDSYPNSMTYNYHPLMDTVQARVKVYYYKPLNYDSTQSPFLVGIHGQNGTGPSTINGLQAIADRRGALIIAPVMPQNGEGIFWEIWGNTQWAFGWATKKNWDSCAGWFSAYYGFWWPPVMKQIYRHAIIRENRNFVSVYLTGFSMGGQFTTRYMLIRQAMPDSIPIIYAVSLSPYFYTFGTDTLNGVPMYFPCGLLRNYPIYCNGCACIIDTTSCCSYPDTAYSLIPNMCNEHIIQYYNENYAVLIGTADTTGAPSTGLCMQVQGNNRYERAKNFYAFSDSDAVNRGTTLKWQYAEVPGVGHDGYGMYNTPTPGDSIPIAERMLFETPWHPVPYLAPEAGFTAGTNLVFLPDANVTFTNTSLNAVNYYWDFGDSTFTTNIDVVHAYTYADTFTVTLTAFSASGCSNKAVKKNYIIVKQGIGISEHVEDAETFFIHPTVSSDGKFSVQFKQNPVLKSSIEVYNILSERIYAAPLYSSHTVLDLRNFTAGMYYIKCFNAKGWSEVKKIIISK